LVPVPTSPTSRLFSRSFQRHAKCDSSKNPRTTLVIDLARERKRKEERELTTPHVVHLVRKAEEWQGLLQRGEVKNRVELARRFQVSGMRVTTILALLKLHPDIRAAAEGSLRIPFNLSARSGGT
jgi:hypothetical protein